MALEAWMYSRMRVTWGSDSAVAGWNGNTTVN